MYCQNCGTQFEGNFCPACGMPRNPAVHGARQSPQTDAQHAQADEARPLTKRWWFWALIAVTVIALGGAFLWPNAKKTDAAQEKSPAQIAAAAAATQKPAPTATPRQGLAAGALFGQKDTAPVPVGLAETVLLDRDGIRVVATGLSEHAWIGPEIAVLVENNTGQAITVQARDVSVNGAMITPVFSCDVAAGKKANNAISFYQTDLDRAGIVSMRTIELKILVFEAEDWDTILETDAVRIVTNAPDEAQVFDESGYVALDQGGIRLIVRGVSAEESFWGKDVSVFIENRTGRDVTLQLRNVSLNGFMMTPFFSCELVDGKVAYTAISFSSEDLEANGIDDFETLECSLLVFDMDLWDTIFESGLFTVTF